MKTTTKTAAPKSCAEAIKAARVTPRALCRIHCQIFAGDSFSENVCASALEKFARHIRNKYGSLDWTEEVAENGDLKGVLHFYEETRDGVTDTFNRQTAANARA